MWYIQLPKWFLYSNKKTDKIKWGKEQNTWTSLPQKENMNHKWEFENVFSLINKWGNEM